MFSLLNLPERTGATGLSLSGRDYIWSRWSAYCFSSIALISRGFAWSSAISSRLCPAGEMSPAVNAIMRKKLIFYTYSHFANVFYPFLLIYLLPLW